jgi:hypothetical protein
MEACGLSLGVDARVGSAGSDYFHSCAEGPRHGGLDLALHAAAGTRQSLPTQEIRSVVRELDQKIAAGHAQ